MEKKIIVITGASNGIGYATAEHLAAEGHKVIAVARTESSLKQLESAWPDHVKAWPLDLMDSDALSRLSDSLEYAFDKIDVLIHNAGALVKKPFQELTDQDWQHMIEMNLMSGVRLARALFNRIRIGGHIVNISTMGAFQGSKKYPGLAAYTASKGGLTTLTECLAAEMEERQVAVNALCLGSVQTDMFEQAFPGVQAPVTPVEMARQIAWFALDGQTFYNGKVLPVALQDP